MTYKQLGIAFGILLVFCVPFVYHGVQAKLGLIETIPDWTLTVMVIGMGLSNLYWAACMWRSGK